MPAFSQPVRPAVEMTKGWTNPAMPNEPEAGTLPTSQQDEATKITKDKAEATETNNGVTWASDYIEVVDRLPGTEPGPEAEPKPSEQNQRPQRKSSVGALLRAAREGIAVVADSLVIHNQERSTRGDGK